MTLAVTLTGCSLLYAPSSDLTSGAASDDGGGGAESSPPDGSADGRTDASLPTCPPTALLCDDFERDRVLGSFDTASGNVTLSSGRAHSPTRSLRAIAKANQDSPSLRVQLPLPTKTTLSFWLYTPTAPKAGTNFRVADALWGGACDWELAVSIFLNADGGLTLSASSYDQGKNPSCGPVADDSRTLLLPSELFVPMWHHVVVKMDVSKQTRLVDSTIDERAVAPSSVKSIRSTVPSSAAVSVGIPCINTNSGCFTWDGPDFEVLLDDVMLIATP